MDDSALPIVLPTEFVEFVRMRIPSIIWRACIYNRGIVMDSILSNPSLTALAALPRQVEGVSGLLLILDGVLSHRECQAVIAAAEASGFERAGFYSDPTTGAPVVVESIRKSLRCMIDSHAFADALWERICHAVPARLPNGLCARRVNERLRILKYLPGDEFKAHRDGCYASPDGTEVGQLTVLIYLNERYTGAHTTYYPTGSTDDQGIAVIPTSGTVVLQDPALVHAVPPLESGIKYALRTEVMYGAQ
jgi:hypothetical protein